MPFKSGDIVTVDFPGVTGIKRRPDLIGGVFVCA